MLASGKSLNEILGLNIGYEYRCMRDRLDCYEANILAQLLSLARRIDEICSFLSKMAESLAEKLYGEKYSLIQTVPGIGRTLAYMILAEIDDIRRFPSARHFKAIVVYRRALGRVVVRLGLEDVGMEIHILDMLFIR